MSGNGLIKEGIPLSPEGDSPLPKSSMDFALDKWAMIGPVITPCSMFSSRPSK